MESQWRKHSVVALDYYARRWSDFESAPTKWAKSAVTRIVGLIGLAGISGEPQIVLDYNARIYSVIEAGRRRITWRTRLPDESRQKRGILLVDGDLPHQSLDDLRTGQVAMEFGT